MSGRLHAHRGQLCSLQPNQKSGGLARSTLLSSVFLQCQTVPACVQSSMQVLNEARDNPVSHLEADFLLFFPFLKALDELLLNTAALKDWS